MSDYGQRRRHRERYCCVKGDIAVGRLCLRLSESPPPVGSRANAVVVHCAYRLGLPSLRKRREPMVRGWELDTRVGDRV